MMTAWILGTFFFLFVICFIVYVQTIDVNEPESAPRSRPAAVSSSTDTDGLVADMGKYLISKDYQVVFSPRAFVGYPFGIKVVFARTDASEPVPLKPAARTGNPRSNVQRSFKASEYHGWPESALKDPELTVVGGRVEFESEEMEPTIRVELKSPGDSFQAIKTFEERVLKRDGNTVFFFWLNPLEAKPGSLNMLVSRVPGTSAAETTAGNGDRGEELATIALTVPVTPFPIALR
jgi:hypothetical protein